MLRIETNGQVRVTLALLFLISFVAMSHFNQALSMRACGSLCFIIWNVMFLVEQVEKAGKNATNGWSERISVQIVVHEMVISKIRPQDRVCGLSDAHSRVEASSERVGSCDHSKEARGNTGDCTDTLADTSSVLTLDHEDD